MNAKEIRDERSRPGREGFRDFQHEQTFFLAEIAAQLAELNDLRQTINHLADLADSLRKIAQSLEVTIVIEGGSPVPPLPPAKGKPS